jgi:hypothetical protein
MDLITADITDIKAHVERGALDGTCALCFGAVHGGGPSARGSSAGEGAAGGHARRRKADFITVGSL